MTKQPDPSRSSLPPHGSVGSSSIPSEASPEPAPVAAKLKTIAPKIRSKKVDPDEGESLPVIIRNAKRRRKNHSNPFASFSPPLVTDFDPAVHAIEENAQSPEQAGAMTFRDRIERNRNPFSSMLISTATHLAILILLASFVIDWNVPERAISVLATIDSTPIPENPSETESETIPIALPIENTSPIEMSADSIATDLSEAAVEAIEVVPNVTTETANPSPDTTEANVADNATTPTGGGLEGRELSARARLATERGGSRESEVAVELGLKWILAHQRANGGWRFKHDCADCNGQCGNEGRQESSTAATGLALMSLLGAGYTHRTGPYQKQIQKGLDYLVERMRITHRGGSMSEGKPGMYSHAIATIALSEALAMTGDTLLMGPVTHAQKYIETAQHKKGGWRYIPGTRGDMTVTGWQLMALKSCELSGVRSGELTYQQASDFLDSLQSTSGCFGYQAPAETPTTTAVGVLSKMYLGAHARNHALEQGTRFVADQGPSKNDVYFNYYATQLLHHRRDEAWPKWNEEMRDYLVAKQDSSNTHQAGSWHFQDRHGNVGGRLYTTAMAVMILEVYYRYLPLYGEDAVK